MNLIDRWRRRREAADARSDISGADNIRKKLAALCAERCNCELQLGEEIFTTIFLTAEKSHFLVDIIMPTYGNDLLRRNEEVAFGYLERSVPYVMNCRFLGKDTAEGYAALRFAMPEVIRYSNRRSHFRVAPATSRPVRIVIDFGMNQLADTSLKDISASGVAIASGLSRYVGVGQRVGAVEIEMPGGEWLVCSGIVRRISGTTIGIELEELTANDRTRLYRYVSERQQEIISDRRRER